MSLTKTLRTTRFSMTSGALGFGLLLMLLIFIMGAANLIASFQISRHAQQQAKAQEKAREQQGLLIERKLCLTLSTIHSKSPPPIRPSNPDSSRVYLHWLHTQLGNLGQDIGCGKLHTSSSSPSPSPSSGTPVAKGSSGSSGGRTVSGRPRGGEPVAAPAPVPGPTVTSLFPGPGPTSLVTVTATPPVPRPSTSSSRPTPHPSTHPPSPAPSPAPSGILAGCPVQILIVKVCTSSLPTP